MAKKSTGKLSVGSVVRVKPGVTAPESPQCCIEHWTGTIGEVLGKTNPRFVVEWDADTLARIPADYVQQCEQNGLYYRMACLSADDLELCS